jgi:hypothetical protein
MNMYGVWGLLRKICTLASPLIFLLLALVLIPSSLVLWVPVLCVFQLFGFQFFSAYRHVLHAVIIPRFFTFGACFLLHNLYFGTDVQFILTVYAI